MYYHHNYVFVCHRNINVTEMNYNVGLVAFWSLRKSLHMSAYKCICVLMFALPMIVAWKLTRVVRALILFAVCALHIVYNAQV